MIIILHSKNFFVLWITLLFFFFFVDGIVKIVFIKNIKRVIFYRSDDLFQNNLTNVGYIIMHIVSYILFIIIIIKLYYNIV